MRRFLQVIVPLFMLGGESYAQTVTAVTGLRFYEHHSPTIAGTQGGANGTQSGYDFVNRRYYHSYNAMNTGKYLNGEEANIDMVEFNGPYGNQGAFGFTSGMSNIWVNEIQGNGITKWMKAPASFDYTALSNVAQIAAAYSTTTASLSIPVVEANTVYLGRIRNTNLYVAMRVSSVKNKTSSDNNVYFDFEYKYGTLSGTSVEGERQSELLKFYPNPAGSSVKMDNKGAHSMNIELVSLTGQSVKYMVLAGGSSGIIDIRDLPNGLYFVACKSGAGTAINYKLWKQ